MNWSGHWHGYGPWIGDRKEYGQEQQRRPGASPDDDQTRTFLASPLPPMMTGHALMRRKQTAPGRTWTTVGEAVDWLTKVYADRPPSFAPSDLYASLEDMMRSKARHAEESLSGGSDDVWAYYAPNGAFIHYSVICCPNRLHPAIPCPLPPS
jgi:hypothetical protein